MARIRVTGPDPSWQYSTGDPPIRHCIEWERDGHILICTVVALPEGNATADDAAVFLAEFTDTVADDLRDTFDLASTTIRYRTTLRGTRTTLHLRILFTPQIVRYANDRVLPPNHHDPASAA